MRSILMDCTGVKHSPLYYNLFDHGIITNMGTVVKYINVIRSV